MSIKNGNTDFNLSVTPGRQDRTIKIRFKKRSAGANPIRITVSTPHTNVEYNSYNDTTDNDYVEWVIRVSNYGDFKVHISTNRGYSYDYEIIKLRLNSEASQTYTFTSEDHTRWRLKGLIVGLSGIGLGLTTYLSWAVAAGTAVCELAGFYFATSDPRATMYDFSPRVGYSIRATYIDSGSNYIEFKLEYLDEEFDVKNTATKKVLIDTF